jgi:hypothetical protein
MKNLEKLLLLGLVLLFPASCSEDAVLESIVSAERTENEMVMQQELGLIKILDLDLKPSLKLSERAFAVRDSIETQMAQEYELLMIAGRGILRDRGVDPATAFPGGINDPRLATVALIIDDLDSIGYEYYKQGLEIIDIYDIPADNNSTVTNGNTISITQDNKVLDDVFDCIGDEGARVGLIFGSIGAFAEWAGISGAIVVGVAGSTALTVTGAIAVAGGFYLAYKVRKCLDNKWSRNPDCTITQKLDINCAELVRRGIEHAGIYATCEGAMCTTVYDECLDQVRSLVYDKINRLELRLADTLVYAVYLEEIK